MFDQLSTSQIAAIIVPLAIVELVLLITGLVALAKAERTHGPKWLWALIIIFVTTFGPILFFLFGRKRD